MEKAVRLLAIVFLFILGISALFGSIPMILDPTGEKIRMPLEMLEKTPFDTFLVPAIILGSVNGLLSILIAVMTIKRVKFYGWLVILQGCILGGWLTAEVLMGMFSAILHGLYYSVALVLIVTGIMLVRKQPFI
jgi:hypothetical protein